MIKSLNIKNFILIDELTLNFEKGFTVFTGETGAGKSIILNSIDIVLGAKSGKELIKKGETSAYIEITFILNKNNQQLLNVLHENEINIEENSELIISKEINGTSSRSRVNGVIVTQDFIKTIRELLVDIHTQHQSYIYMQPKFHIDLLDRYGDDSHKNLLKEFESYYNRYIEIKKELEKISKYNDTTTNQIDFLKFQIQEIEEGNIEDVNEDTKLDEELKILSNAGEIKQTATSVYYALSEDESAVLSQLNYIKSNLNKFSDIDKNINEFRQDTENSIDILRELSSKIRNYAEYIEVDEEKIATIEARIEILEKLKRKYGHTLENVLSNYNNFVAELNSIENSYQSYDNLKKEEQEIYVKITEMGEKLSEDRQYMAERLSSIMTQELEKLELPKVRFKIDCQSSELNNKGFDKVEFLISTNISEDIKPLSKVASGGEISRVMLALKTIFAEADMINTVIFDEIDTGISGIASQAVADELKLLSGTHQVIAITHQPIIAAKADNHMYVVKKQDDTTSINVYLLSHEERLHAIAMLASGNDNEESIKFAKQLIESTN